MRTHECDTAMDLLPPALARGLQECGLPLLDRPLLGIRGAAWSVRHRRDRVFTCDSRVSLGDVGVEVGDETQACVDDHRAEIGQLLIPDVQGALQVLIARSGLEECAALLHHAFVVSAHAGQTRCTLDHEVVEERSPLRGITLHQAEVLRCEHDHTHDAEDLARASHLRPIDARTIRLTGSDLQVDGDVPLVLDDVRTHDPRRTSLAHQRCIVGDTVTAQGRQVPDHFDDVGLALPVGTDETRGSWGQLDVRLRVGTDVGEAECVQPHGCGLSR